MQNLYDKNGLVFWDQAEIDTRDMIADYLKAYLESHLATINPAFRFFRCEAPQITPIELLNEDYLDPKDRKVFPIDSIAGLALRPETTMGSYAYARYLLNPHNERKVRMPLVVWQYGKSFRAEQDQPIKHMKLKEFYQLEFQIIFAESTANDYYPGVTEAMLRAITLLLPAHLVKSDRLPAYSSETMDLAALTPSGLEIASMSRRTDFEGAKVIEVALGMDRIVSCFLNR